jgi:hypothetical protein
VSIRSFAAAVAVLAVFGGAPAGVHAQASAATASGNGGYLKAWTDPANGVRIILTLLPGQGGPMLTYSTLEADAWERRKNDARF